MTAQDVNLNPNPEAERIQRYRLGAEMIFENAEALYNEAQTLGTAGSYARAAVLHQLSMEECAKIDMLGASITSSLMGHPVDEALIERKFREHRVKNFANAYNFETMPEEQEARARGDWKASSEAFKRFQAQFHSGVNNLKNDGLYVDFKDGSFSSPKDAITEEVAATAQHLNAEFIQRSALFIRLLKRMEKDPEKFARFSKQFLRRAQGLRQEAGADPEALMRKLLEEMKDSYVSEAHVSVPVNPPRRHHFIPQSWIKRFESADGKLWSFDRHEGTIKPRSSKALMQLFNLYTVQPSGVDDTTLESVDLDKIDNDGARAFAAVLNGDHSQAAKLSLADFLAVQFMRDPDTITSYGPKAQEFLLALLEVFKAPDYTTFSKAFSAIFPGPQKVEEFEYNHIKSLGPVTAAQALESMIDAFDVKGGLPDLPFTDLVRSPDGRNVMRTRLLSFQWLLKASPSLPFVLGDTGILAERGDVGKLSVPLSKTAALFLVPSDNPTSDILVSAAADNEVKALNWESAARARRWLVGEKTQLEQLKDQVSKDLSALK